MSGYQPTFYLPYTELHPYYKKLIQFMRKYNFCILDAEALLDPTFNTDHQLEAFRCAVRELSNERGRNVIIDDSSMEARIRPDGIVLQDIIFQLADSAEDPGSLPEVWDQKDEAVANALAGQKKLLH
ncbi:MAG: hypothetical protein ACR2QH_15140 [Geminicoccaceae bacterium]